MRVRQYQEADWPEPMRMASALFPGEPRDDLASGMRAFLRRDDGAVFAAERDGGGLSGYVQAGERPCADGCATSPVGFIEEWYVDPAERRQGIGRALAAAAEGWARAGPRGDGVRRAHRQHDQPQCALSRWVRRSGASGPFSKALGVLTASRRIIRGVAVSAR